jgi:hypothetical protein
MVSLWLAAYLLAAPPAVGVVKSAPAQPAAEAPPATAEPEPFYESDPETDAAIRSAYDLKSQVRDSLRLEATSAGEEHLSAVLELVAVYRALQADQNLAQDESIQLKAQVRSRLLKIAAQTRNNLKREATQAAKTAKLQAKAMKSSGSPGELSAEGVANQSNILATKEAEAKQVGLKPPAQTLLFQIGAAVGQQAGGAEPAGEALIELIKSATGGQNWQDQGGPGAIYLWKGSSLMKPDLPQLRQAGIHALAGAFGGQAITDHGPELVDLIESVIAPHTWEKNGGFGSIFYFAPLRVIVVRSTGDVHGDVGNVIGNLRAAGH